MSVVWVLCECEWLWVIVSDCEWLWVYVWGLVGNCHTCEWVSEWVSECEYVSECVCVCVIRYLSHLPDVLLDSRPGRLGESEWVSVSEWVSECVSVSIWVSECVSVSGYLSHLPDVLLDSRPGRLGDEVPLVLLSLVGRLGEVGMDWHRSPGACGSAGKLINDRLPSPLQDGHENSRLAHTPHGQTVRVRVRVNAKVSVRLNEAHGTLKGRLLWHFCVCIAFALH